MLELQTHATLIKKYRKETPLNIKTAKKYYRHILRVSYITGGNVDLKDKSVNKVSPQHHYKIAQRR